MRQIASLLLIFVLASSVALAHGGNSGKVLGIVKDVRDGQHVVVTTQDGHEVTVHLTRNTKYQRAGKAVTKKAVAAGARVSVKVAKDGKTAVSVTIGSPKSK